MAIVDPFRVRPAELKAGDVMVCTVTLHVLPRADGELSYRMYHAPWPPTAFSDGVPQGARIANEEAVMGQLFPVAGRAEAKPDVR